MNAPQDRPTILVVDDTPDNLALISTMLGGQYRVKVANSGERAVAMAQSAPPDLVLLDVMMPGMDGFATCTALKDDARTRDIPVIFLTGMAEQDEEEFGLRLGAVDYLSKPVNPALVSARIETHLRLKAATDALREQQLGLQEQRRLSGAEPSQAMDSALLALSGRLTAAADAYEALRSGAGRTEPVSHEQALAMVAAGSSRMFTPDLADALMAAGRRLREIAERYPDASGRQARKPQFA